MSMSADLALLDAPLNLQGQPGGRRAPWRRWGGTDSAVKAFERLRAEGATPGIGTVLEALKTCGRIKDAVTGAKIHALLLETGVHSSHIFVANTLVDMYAKCRRLQDARRVFETMPQRDAISWNCIIMGYAQAGEGRVALELYARMEAEGCAGSDVTLLAALRACVALAERVVGKHDSGRLVKSWCLDKGRFIHARAAAAGLEKTMFVASALVDMYAKCGSMDEASRVFESLSRRDAVCWNCVVMGYAQAGQGKEALLMYDRMVQEGWQPNDVAILAALRACASLAQGEAGTEWLAKGREIHSHASRYGYDRNNYVANSLIDMYAKCGSMDEASQVFQWIRKPDTVSWNCMIMAYVEKGQVLNALYTYCCMMQDALGNAITFIAALKACTSCIEEVQDLALRATRAVHRQAAVHGHESYFYLASTLVGVYVRLGCLQDACRVFETLRCPDVVSWNCLVNGYAQNGQVQNALRLYRRMRQDGCSPDSLTFVAILKACGAVAALQTGRRICRDVHVAGLQADAMIANSMIDFYCRCGSMAEAEQVFDWFTSRDLVSWNALMMGHSRQGDSGRVFELFDMLKEQRQLQPDAITLVAVLTACSHGGLLDRGRAVFQAMVAGEYTVKPELEHYTCMIDLLGRVNQLHEAVGMLEDMPMQPDAVLWHSLLSSCWKWRNVELGKVAFEKLVELEKGSSFAGAYVMMHNIYAAAGLWTEAVGLQPIPRRGECKPGMLVLEEQSWWTDPDKGDQAHSFVC